MADSTVTIGGDISDLQTKLKQAGAGVKSFGSQSRTALQGIDLGKAFAVAGGVAGLTSLLKVGFEFNQTMKDGEVAIGNVLKTFKGLNDQAAKSEAARVVQMIAEAEPKAAGGLRELTQGFIASAAAASTAGLSVEENVDLVARFANALANSGLPLDQLNQEIRSVLTANITSDSFVGKLLEGKGLNNARIEQLSKEGKLYGVIVKELGALGEAGDTAGVALSTLMSAIQKTLGAVSEGLFDQSVSSAKEMAVYLEENRDLFLSIGEAAKTFGAGLLDALGYLKNIGQFMGAVGFAAFGDAENVIDANLINQARARGMNQEADAVVGGQSSRDTPFITDALVKDLAEKQFIDGIKTTPKRSLSATDTEEAPAATRSKKELLAIEREIEAVERMREKLGERQFASLLRHLTPQLQIEAIQKRINEHIQDGITLQLESSQSTEADLLTHAEAMLDLEEQLARAKQARASAATEAAEKESAANQKLLEQAKSLADIQATTEILKAQASGDDKKAAALQRQAEIQQAVANIVAATNVSEAEALRIAEEQQQLKEQIAANQEQVTKNQDRTGRIDASIADGGVETARQRAEERLRRSRDSRTAAVEGAFGTFAGEDAAQKSRFAAQFGPAGDTRQNPAAVDAAKAAAPAGADAASIASSAAQIVVQSLPQIVQILSGGAT